MVAIHPNILEKNGKKEFAILPYNEFVKMQNELEDYNDLKLLRQAKDEEKNSPVISFAKAKKLLLKKPSVEPARTRR